VARSGVVCAGHVVNAVVGRWFCSPKFCSGMRFPFLWKVWINDCS